jgi:hypothetical protein
MRAVLATWMFALVPLVGHADYCVDRSEAALEELGRTAESGADDGNQAGVRAVLERLCRDSQSAATAGRSAAAASEPATQTAAEPESTKIMGVEIKQAPKGAAGYDRARKAP